MADGTIRVQEDGSGKLVDTDQLSVSGQSVERQRVRIAGAAASDLAPVDAANGLDVDVTRVQGTVTVGDGGGSLTVDGTVAVTDGGGSVTVDGSVGVSSLPAGSVAAATAKTSDYDTGAGTDTVPMMGLAIPASGGAVAGGTGTNPVRTDPTGTTAQPITDNGGSLTVDGTVAVTDGGGSVTVDGAVSVSGALPAGTNNIGDVDVLTLPPIPAGTNNIGDVDVLTLPGSLAGKAEDAPASDGDVGLPVLAVRRDAASSGVSADGDYVALSTDSTGALRVTGGGGGQQYAEDAAHSSGDLGTLALGVRRDADTTPVSADGDYHALQFDANGNLKVNIKAGAGSGGTAMTDDAAFTPGTTAVTPAAGTYRTVRDNLDDNDGGAIALTQKRAQLVAIETPNGDSAMDETNDALRVNIVAGAGSGGTAMTDDAAFTPGSTSVTPMGALVDETATDSADEGDIGAPRMTADRKLLTRVVGATDANRMDVDGSGHAQVDLAAVSAVVPINDNGGSVTVDGSVSLAAALPAGTNNIGDVDVLTLPNVTLAAGTNTNEVVGDAAEDAALAGNPVRIGVRASDAVPTPMSADGDVVTPWHDRRGATVARLVDSTGGSAMDDANDSVRATIVAASATVPISDAGGSLTVDGTVSVDSGFVEVTTMPSGASSSNVQGAAAHDATVVGNPVLLGARAQATAPTDVSADGDVVRLWADRAGRLQIGDGGGSVTVDGTVGVSGTVALAAGTNTNEVVGDVAEDAALAGNPVRMGARASDAVPTAMSADGDLVTPWHDRRGAAMARLVDSAGDSVMDDANNAVRVNIIAGAGSGGTAMTDDAAFTPGTTSITPAGGTYRTTRDNLDDNDGGAIALTQKRAQLVCPETPAGDSLVDDTADTLRVSVISVAGSRTDDSAFAVNTDPVSPLGALVDETSTDTVAEGNVGAPRMTGDRKLLVRVVGATDANRLDIDSSGRPTVNVNGTIANAGDVAHDAADSGSPQKIGGQARTTNPTAVADADRVNAIFDDLGRQVVVLNQVRDLVIDGDPVTLTSTTETTILAAGGAGVFHDLTMIELSNTSATGVRVDIRDSTGGTVRHSVFLAASGGGAVIPFSTPRKQATAANNWTAQLSASVTDVRVRVSAVKNV